MPHSFLSMPFDRRRPLRNLAIPTPLRLGKGRQRLDAHGPCTQAREPSTSFGRNHHAKNQAAGAGRIYSR
jgi:hypothetical protein